MKNYWKRRALGLVAMVMGVVAAVLLGAVAPGWAVPGDADNDRVPDSIDLCPGTVIPEGIPAQNLLPFFYALTDADTTFNTFKGVESNFTIAQTGGCSCKQIAARSGLGLLPTKLGCPIAVMQTFVANVAAIQDGLEDLNACTDDLNTCTADLNDCTADLTQAQDDLAACLATAQQFPATGQTTCWNSSGTVIPCAETGQDGDIQAGATLSYTDNGNGTITDNNTGLVWEKLCDEDPPGTTCPVEHDVDTTYTWAAAFGKIAALNTANFAGQNDWRLPNVKELQSIVNYQNLNPAVSSAFHTGCTAACSVTACSCIAAGFYWSSTTFANVPSGAWLVDFFGGGVGATNKVDTLRVRAVWGGQ